MPTIEQNLTGWNEHYSWPEGGDEWSKNWGGPHMQWFGALLPRISSFVPTDTILEIAPGYGRWTAFLKNLCNRLIIVDLSERCIQRCRDRFAHDSHITYFVNDGMSLEMVENSSVDFIFSFDSLVHAEDTVLRAYMAEFAKKLRLNGVAFIHHSNLAEYKNLVRVQSQLVKIPKVVGGLHRLGLVDNVISNWRARSMSAKKMAIFAEEQGLQCVSQELVSWETRSATIDCFSTVVHKGSRWSRQNRVLRNPGFMREAKSLRKISSLYDYERAVNNGKQA